MAHHVVVGAGTIGSGTALALTERGHRVTLITRSGSGPEHQDIARVALDITDAAALIAAARGAAAIYNCVNPPYHRWASDWPPMAAAFLQAAEQTGAGLVTMAPLYLYGHVDAPMTEQTSQNATGTKGVVRKQMWHDALAAHQAGRIRATEVRAGDFFGAGTDKTSLLTSQVLLKVKRGKKVRMIVGDVDVPHAWTYVTDVATMMAVAGTDDRSWGQAWHVPTNAARSIRQVATEAAGIVGREAPSISTIPGPVFNAMGVVVPFVKELRETRYQFDRLFELDSSLAQRTFGLAPTPWFEALSASLAALPG